MSTGEASHVASRRGAYEVLRRIGRGGMAEVHLARAVGAHGFEKLVVLKQILPSYARNPRFVSLFLDEARLAATLDHPNIAQVYDLGEQDGTYFITMEFVHGQELRRVVRRADQLGRPFPLEHALLVARDVAAALHYAHERTGPRGEPLGIVHRDVSPSNVLLSYDGAVKLVDFGVAKAATSSSRTRTGTVKGKLAYMSPEQGRGAAIDRRSDVFSLGIVLWELIAGTRLYQADNDLAILHRITSEDAAPPSVLNAACPPELDRIVLRALQRDPARRHATARELQLELEELAREHKLRLSSAALSEELAALFADELAQWRDAQRAGLTLSQHVLAPPPPRAHASAPAADADSDDEHALEDDDLDDDLDGDAAAGRTDRPLDAATALIARPGSSPSRALTPPPAQVAAAPPAWPPSEAHAVAPPTHSRRRVLLAMLATMGAAFAVVSLVLVVRRGGAVPRPPTAPSSEARPAPGAATVDARPVDARRAVPDAMPDAALARPVPATPDAAPRVRPRPRPRPTPTPSPYDPDNPLPPS